MPWFHRQATLILDSKHLEPTAVRAPAPKHPQVYANSNPYSQPTNKPRWFSLGTRPEFEAFRFSPFTQLKRELECLEKMRKYAPKEDYDGQFLLWLSLTAYLGQADPQGP